MTNCIFCKIVAGEISSTKIFENEHVMAFLDIAPAVKGHTLVIPKKHSENIYDITKKDLQEVISAVQKVSKAAKKGLKADGVNILQSNESIEGQVVFHIHFHVFPRFNGDNKSFKWSRIEYKENEVKEVADKIKNSL